MDPIDGLLRIKRVREERREAEMRRAKHQLETAAEALRRARDEQQQRDRERADRERVLYEQVCTKVVVVRELDDLKFEVDTMKSDAQADAKKVDEAHKQRQKRREIFDEASGAWRVAAQDKQRFEDLADEIAAERAKHAEWLAEIELEEYPARNLLAQAMGED